MKTRIQYTKGAYDAMLGLESYLATSAIDKKLLSIVKLRASQINGCAYCLDMHWKELRHLGETDQRMYSLDAWSECPWYSEKERAALKWTEAVTLIAVDHVPDAVFDEVSAVLSELEIADLTVAIATINAWNRLSISARTLPEAEKKKDS